VTVTRRAYMYDVCTMFSCMRECVDLFCVQPSQLHYSICCICQWPVQSRW